MAAESDASAACLLSDTFLALPSSSKELIEKHVASLHTAASSALAGAVQHLLDRWAAADAALQAWLAVYAPSGAVEYVLVSQEESECVPGVVYYGGCLRATASTSSSASPEAVIADGSRLLATVDDITSSIESALRLHDDALLLLGASTGDDAPPAAFESDAGSGSDGSRAVRSQYTQASDPALFASPVHEDEALSSVGRKRPRGIRGGRAPRRSPSRSIDVDDAVWDDADEELVWDAGDSRKRPRSASDVHASGMHVTPIRPSRRPAAARAQRGRKAAAPLVSAAHEDDISPLSEPRTRSRGRGMPRASMVRRSRQAALLPPARIVRFTRDGSVFTIFDMTTLSDAGQYVFDLAPAGYKDANALTARMKGVLATRNNQGGKTYNHPVDAAHDTDATVQYLVQYLSDPAPVDAAAAAELWSDNVEDQKCTINRIGDAPMKPARAARVIIFTRGGMFRVVETPTMLAASQHVYAAALNVGSPGALSARVGGMLATRDGRGGKTYNHPVVAEGLDVLHYMIQLAADDAPADAAEAWDLWLFNSHSQFDECSRKDGPEMSNRAVTLIAFSMNGRIFSCAAMPTLLAAAATLQPLSGYADIDLASFAWHIYGVLRTRALAGGGPAVFLQCSPDAGDDDVRYIVQYATQPLPKNATEAAVLWRSRDSARLTARGDTTAVSTDPAPEPVIASLS